MTVPDGSISFMSSLSLMHCTCQRPSLLWVFLAWCIAVPASVHLFHDLPKLDSRGVLYCWRRPSLLWALLAWCTIPAGVHLFLDLPKLANSAYLGAVWNLIDVLYLTAPSLLWALLAWCTAYLPASISFMTSRSLPTPPDLELFET